jgi:hypothetical protein
MKLVAQKKPRADGFKIRFSDEERARLDQRAAAAGLQRSEYIRSLVAAEVVPTRINNKSGERAIAFRLAQMDARLADLAGAAQTRLTEATADRFLSHLASIQAELRALAAARREVD